MAALQSISGCILMSGDCATYAIAKVAVTPTSALVLTFSRLSFSSKTLAFFAGCTGNSASMSSVSTSSAFRFLAALADGSPSKAFASSTIRLAVSSICSVSSGNGSWGEPAGISTVTLV